MYQFIDRFKYSIMLLIKAGILSRKSLYGLLLFLKDEVILNRAEKGMTYKEISLVLKKKDVHLR
jgi:hypothetical protein